MILNIYLELKKKNENEIPDRVKEKKPVLNAHTQVRVYVWRQ